MTRTRGSLATLALSLLSVSGFSSGLALLSSLGLSGCDSGNGGGSSEPPPTLVLVDPAEFADNVACGNGSGAMQVYVATLTDVTGDYDGSVPTISSSPPTPCNLAVGFGFVAPGRKYQAQIDAYDRSDITPLTTGSPLMKLDDSQATTLVAPRWTATCGAALPGAEQAPPDGSPNSSGLGPAEAFENSTVTVRGCTTFVE